MAKNTRKVREFCQSGKVGTLLGKMDLNVISLTYLPPPLPRYQIWDLPTQIPDKGPISFPLDTRHETYPLLLISGNQTWDLPPATDIWRSSLETSSKLFT